ncbi:MAG: protein-disulfide reductase DsbD domain-containing protein [Pseudomonadota bacterium]
MTVWVHRLLSLMLLAGLLLLMARAVQAQELAPGAAPPLATDFIDSGQAESRLIAETPLVPGQTTWFALDQNLADHWHVYWKNPGDSGLPLVMAFNLPAGYGVGEIVHPTPTRIPVGPLVNFGYEGNPVFLVPVTAPIDAPVGDTVPLTVAASWLICEEVCIPEEASFSLTVPIVSADDRQTDQARSPFAALFTAARARIPDRVVGESTYEVSETVFTLTIELPPAVASVKDAYFFADLEGLLKPSAPQSHGIKDGILTVSAEPDFAFTNHGGQPVAGLIKLVDDAGNVYAFELSAATDPMSTTASPVAQIQINQVGSPAEVSSSVPATNLPLLFFMAFFGGIILNVMPCVFPILFIKASSFMTASAQDRATVRAHGWLYTAGVVVTFAAMGGLLLALRAGGEDLGWGFHLQSPPMVLLSAYVLFLVGLNLAGVFHVGTSLQGVGQSLTRGKGAGTAFFTGVLAVLVAAPCIGPLLSAPMGAAVFLPPVAGMAIFVAMAFGLAAPYLLLSLVPGLGARLPKPGAWMETFKQFLSFPVFAAAAYFLWVLAAQTGSAGLAVGFAGALVLGLAAWIFEQTKSGKWSLAGAGVVGLLLVAALVPLTSLKPRPAMANIGGVPGAHGAMTGIAFDADEIARLNAAGTDVFVDFTAAWCVTCQFNKLTIFSSGDLAAAFEQTSTTFMVADWTVRDPHITAELEKFGRNGVPLYVHYPAGGTPKVLNLPLTERAVTALLAGP